VGRGSPITARFSPIPFFRRALANTAIVTIGSQVLVVVLATAAAQVFRAAFHGKRTRAFRPAPAMGGARLAPALAWT